MALKPVLILTAAFGEGHNAAARNMRDALLTENPERPVALHDIFSETYPVRFSFLSKGYIAMINRAPAVWNIAFDFFHNTTFLQDGIWVFFLAAKRLKALLQDLQPAVVVTTYPGNNHLLDYIFRGAAKRPFQQVTCITDSLTINSAWYRCQSDYFLVANEQTANVVRDAGVPEEKIKTLGFPVPLAFANKTAIRTTPPADNRWKVLYMINSGRQIAPAIVKELLKIENIALTVTVGKDEALGKKIASIAGLCKKEISLYGWTPEIPRLIAESHLLISKAGGATVQETLAAETPMIITQIVPGQEEGNALLVESCYAGLIATTPETIASAVKAAFSGDASIYRSWLAGAEKLSRPKASQNIAQFINQLSHEN